MALLQAIVEYFSPRLTHQQTRTFQQSDFADTVLPATTSVVGNRTREIYVVRGASDEKTVKAITRMIVTGSAGRPMTAEQIERQRAMGAMVAAYVRGNFPVGHELSLAVTRGPLSVQYSLHHYDSNHRLIHELTLKIDR